MSSSKSDLIFTKAVRLPLSNLPKFVRERLKFEPALKSKRQLTQFLTALIEDYFSNHKLQLSPEQVSDSYRDLPEWRIDTVLAKLRSLMEIKAKRDIRIFCAKLPEKTRKEAQFLLRQASIYNFRDSLDLDLYVGVHTAISAYFKMIGVALTAARALDLPAGIPENCAELSKTLRFIASLPLRYLMAFDGLFWDSKQYFIPKDLYYETAADGIHFYLESEAVEKRLASVCADEEQCGCPALRARTGVGLSVFELLEQACIDCVEEFFIRFPPTPHP